MESARNLMEIDSAWGLSGKSCGPATSSPMICLNFSLPRKNKE
jgi:hypothetical protein